MKKKHRFSVSLYALTVTSIVLATLAAVSVCITIFVTVYSRALMRDAKLSAEQAVRQTELAVNANLDTMKEDLSSVLRLVKESADTEEFYQKVSSVVKLEDDIFAVTVYDADGGIVVCAGSGYARKENVYRDLSFDKELFDGDYRYALSGPHVQTLFEYMYPWVVTMATKTDEGVLGEGAYVAIDFKFSQIAKYIDAVGVGRQGYCYIIDRSGNIVYHLQQQLLYSGLKSEDREKVSGLSDGVHVEKDHIRALVTTADGRWRIVGVSSTEELAVERRTQIITSIGLSLFCTALIACVVLLVYSRIVTAPVRSLMRAMKMCIRDRGSTTNDDKKSDGEVAVFYYTYSDTYISSVRSALDNCLKKAGVKYQNYDANGNQTTQTEQVTTAIAKGASVLVVNVVDTGSNDAAQNIIDQAKAKNIPVIFFNRSVEESVVTSYDKCVFVGTDYEMAGHMQGEMIGNYVNEHFADIDLNGDGKISYVMFKGQEGNMEAIARTQYGVEDADKILKDAGREALSFYDESNDKKYLVDQNGLWSSAAATDYMSTILAKYSESNNNMVELVIANNDEMALGAISALQAAGYNKDGGKTIPVFGVDATEAAKDAINNGSMIGSIKQDAEGMANVISTIAQNFLGEKSTFDGVNAADKVGEMCIRDRSFGMH